MKATSIQLRSGQQWLNSRNGKIYLVVGFTEHCDSLSAEEFTEVLYRSDDMPYGCYRHRSVKDWFGLNRDKEPRFLPYFLLSQNQHLVLEKLKERFTISLTKLVLIEMLIHNSDFDVALAKVCCATQ